MTVKARLVSLSLRNRRSILGAGRRAAIAFRLRSGFHAHNAGRVAVLTYDGIFYVECGA